MVIPIQPNPDAVGIQRGVASDQQDPRQQDFSREAAKSAKEEEGLFRRGLFSREDAKLFSQPSGSHAPAWEHVPTFQRRVARRAAGAAKTAFPRGAWEREETKTERKSAHSPTTIYCSP